MPLNPTLFHRLQEEFGRVISAQEGLAATKRYVPSTRRNKSMELQFDGAGEYYRVNCPWCHDTRGRLWINHTWGVPDEQIGGLNLWAAVCYNENCLSVYGRPRELYDRVYGFKNAKLRGKPLVILPGEAESNELTEVAAPGVIIRVDHLPLHHDVNAYLRMRGYDPRELAESYGVSFCVNADSDYPQAHQRIVVPIQMRGMLVGWQCRYVGDVDWKATRIPKYYSRPNMPKRLMLYNYDNALKYGFAVVVEGPSDVWNVGEFAVALLGKHPSNVQASLLCKGWEGGVLFVMLDGDAKESTDALTQLLKASFKGTVLPIHLPKDADPGSVAREVLWDMLSQEAAAANIDLATLEKEENAPSSVQRVLPFCCPQPGLFSGRGVVATESISSSAFDRPRDAATGS